MRKLYQTEWQHIDFSSFQQMSSIELAGHDFYDAFYRALFEKYRDYDALDPDWRRTKDETTDWLAGSLSDGARVLSVGCGLGYMEQRLWRLHGDRIELHVQDYASQALNWLRQVLPVDRIHDAGAGGGEIGQFDLIYLSEVDYALSDDDLIALLAEVRQDLRDGGQLVMISESFFEESAGGKVLRNGKDAVKWLLDKIGVRKRGQFWGWMRSRQEYQAIMRKAGLFAVTDGFLETPHKQAYWIKGMG
jgi:SAM-dependent methyltransferase